MLAFHQLRNFWIGVKLIKKIILQYVKRLTTHLKKISDTNKILKPIRQALSLCKELKVNNSTFKCFQ